MSDGLARAFEEHRGRLFGIAYRMLGSVADAEDVVQDAWLKWSQAAQAAQAGEIAHPGAYLARTVTNLSLSRLSSAAVQRERYVGPWLPEPLVSAPDVAEEVEQAESVSLAMLVVLESLSPLERAVFVLREVFGYAYPEIAEALGRSEPAVRQLAHRARSHVAARRPRFDTSAEEQRRVTEEFLAACVGGDMGRMLELLAPDVVLWADGGGKAQAALRPVRGADKVARWALGVTSRLVDVGMWRASVNGRPGMVLTLGGRLDTVASVEVVDGRIAAIHFVRNPDKLRHVELPPRL
ncbi:RNA polymerase sigma-70 factor [Streptomyces sp. 6N223]|uniref:RNA polymerase sigma-70 factor n=1 Tax=Streptomyces sp. 6N223 TaxID=3457412 RepID=UPI003FD5387E